jgi:hypothetical protein
VPASPRRLLQRLLFASRFAPEWAPLPCAVPPRLEPAPVRVRPRSACRARGVAGGAWGLARACAPNYPARHARSVDKSQPLADSGNQVPSQEILNCLREHRGNTEETVRDLEVQLDRKLPLRSHQAVVLCAVPPPRSRLKSELRACPCRLDVGGQVRQEGEEKAGGQVLFQSGAVPHMHGSRRTGAVFPFSWAGAFVPRRRSSPLLMYAAGAISRTRW